MFEKNNLFVAVVIGLLLLLFSVQYTAFGSGTDNAHAAGSIGSGSSDDNHELFLPVVVKPYTDIEHIALMALYNSTNGQSWSNNSGWGVGDPCDMAWKGVKCDSGHVQRLDLGNNQLNGAIPAELGNLSSLTDLFLPNNELSGSIPAELGNLSEVEVFILFGNLLSGSIPAELGNLSTVRHFDLGRNQLTGLIPTELGNLSNLRFLNLFENQLNGAIPSELGNLHELGWLYLRDNQLSGAIPAELGNLSSLVELTLNDNPSLSCWETEEALNWARGLAFYLGPDAVCP